jgi:hypothetical protein
MPRPICTDFEIRPFRVRPRLCLFLPQVDAIIGERSLFPEKLDSEDLALILFKSFLTADARGFARIRASSDPDPLFCLSVFSVFAAFSVLLLFHSGPTRLPYAAHKRLTSFFEQDVINDGLIPYTSLSRFPARPGDHFGMQADRCGVIFVCI